MKSWAPNKPINILASTFFFHIFSFVSSYYPIFFWFIFLQSFFHKYFLCSLKTSSSVFYILFFMTSFFILQKHIQKQLTVRLCGSVRYPQVSSQCIELSEMNCLFVENLKFFCLFVSLAANKILPPLNNLCLYHGWVLIGKRILFAWFSVWKPFIEELKLL